MAKVLTEVRRALARVWCAAWFFSALLVQRILRLLFGNKVLDEGMWGGHRSQRYRVGKLWFGYNRRTLRFFFSYNDKTVYWQVQNGVAPRVFVKGPGRTKVWQCLRGRASRLHFFLQV